MNKKSRKKVLVRNIICTAVLMIVDLDFTGKRISSV